MIVICVTIGLQHTESAQLVGLTEEVAEMLHSDLHFCLDCNFLEMDSSCLLEFLITKTCFQLRGFGVGGCVFPWKMVRFGRLSSWRSWDLLHVDSEIPESPPSDTKPALTNYQVRGLLTCLCTSLSLMVQSYIDISFYFCWQYQ